MEEKLYQNYLTDKLDPIMEVTDKEVTFDFLPGTKKWKVVKRYYNKKSKKARPNSILDVVTKNSLVDQKQNETLQYNLVDEEGNYMCEYWSYEPIEFNDGIYTFYIFYENTGESDHKYFYNSAGTLLGKNRRDMKIQVKDGYVLVRRDGWEYVVNINGETINDNKYEVVRLVNIGYSFVGVHKEDMLRHVPSTDYEYKFNIMDPKGKLLSDTWYDEIKEVIPGIFKVVKYCDRIFNKKCNLMNKEGKLISDEWFDSILKFSDGYALVKKDDKYNYMDENGKLMSTSWFTKAQEYFSDGLTIVASNNTYLIFKSNGEVLTDDKFQEANPFEKGYALVKRYNKWNYIDADGKYYYKNWSKNRPLPPVGKYRKVEEKVKDNPLEYSFSKTPFGYKCYNMEDNFKVKYEPIKIYSPGIVLCEKDGYIILYDRQKDKYITLGVRAAVNYDDNFIYLLTQEGPQALYVYDDKIIDITDYLMKKGNGKLVEPKIKINIPENYEILTSNEFAALRTYEQEELIRKEKLENIRKIENDKSIKQIEEEKALHEKAEQEVDMETKDMLIQVKTLLEKVQQAKGKIKHKKIMLDDVVVQSGDHNVIKPAYIENGMLPYIDLTFVNFMNTDISGVNFKGCNPTIYPQTVYNKDMRNCNMEGIFISPLMDFTGVDIRGARFSDDEDPMTPDGRNVTFINSIYDETTTYNGIPFTKIYGPCNKVQQSENKLKKM